MRPIEGRYGCRDDARAWRRMGQHCAGRQEIPDAEDLRSLDGRELYAWCAPDTLLFPSLMEGRAIAEWPCRATGEPVRVEVGPEGVHSVEPADAVVFIGFVGAGPAATFPPS